MRIYSNKRENSMNTKLSYTDNSLLIVLSGPSGAGKGTLKNMYMQEHKENTYFSVSATTRSPRECEIHGVDYIFVDKNEFEEMKSQNEFLEYAFVHGEYYATPRKNAVEQLEKGNDVIFDIDVQGGLNIKKQCPEAIMIFIAPPDMETLEKRLRKRGTETEERILRRLANAEGELKHMPDYDYVILNDSVEEAYAKLKAIITAEKCRSGNITRFDIQ